MRIKNLCFAIAVAAGVLPSITASAQYHRDREWHGDIHRFHERDFHRWRGGHWYHGAYRGRAGWWWVVNGVYYWYPRPIYPFPDPYTPPTVVVQPPLVVQPPAVVQAPPPAVAQVPPAPQSAPQPSTWYYCDSAQAYYPYVAECPSGWRTVPASPPRG